MISHRYYPYYRMGYSISDIFLLFLVYHFTFAYTFDKVPRVGFGDGLLLAITGSIWALVAIAVGLNDIRRDEDFEDYIKEYFFAQIITLLTLSSTLLFAKITIPQSFVISFCLIQMVVLFFNRLFGLHYPKQCELLDTTEEYFFIWFRRRIFTIKEMDRTKSRLWLLFEWMVQRCRC